MNKRSLSSTHLLTLGLCTVCAPACGNSAHELSGARGALEAQCTQADEAGELPADAWVCPEARTVECTSGTGTADVDKLYVTPEDNASCENASLAISDTGPFPVGVHTVTVSNEGDELCSAQLTVTDTAAPVAASHTIQLWPPNHKFHSIAVNDCVSFNDACEGNVTGEFIWASSDEPVDDKGDGHHAPDIQIDDCGHVSVRAERAGPKNGRVYKLGVRMVDAGGQATEGECTVIVDHDQRGVVGADDGESYRITFDGTQDTLACDGQGDDPPASGDGDAAGDGDSTAGDGDATAGDGDATAGDGDATAGDGDVEVPPAL